MVTLFFKSNVDNGKTRQDWSEIHGNFVQLSPVCKKRQLAAESTLLEIHHLDAKRVTQCGYKYRFVKMRTGERDYFILEGKVSISEIP